MNDLVYKTKDVIGLDIGTSTVKFVQLKKSGKLIKLIGYGRIDIPQNYIVEGIISEPEKLGEVISASFKNPPWGKITAKRIYASLPESKMFTRIIDLPKLESKDITEAINYEMEQSIPVSSDDLYSDWQTLKEDNSKITIFLAAAPKSIVNSYVQLIDELKMDPGSLEMSMTAIARSMISNKNSSEPVIILDIGDQSSNIGIFDSNLRITGTHPIGGGTIKTEVANEFGKTDKESFEIIQSGIEKDNEQTRYIKEKINVLVEEMKKVVSYFEDQNPDVKIEKVLICGGLAFMPGLPEYLKEQTGYETKVGNPWVNISIYPLKTIRKEEAPTYACAVGLCLRGLKDD